MRTVRHPLVMFVMAVLAVIGIGVIAVTAPKSPTIKSLAVMGTGIAGLPGVGADINPSIYEVATPPLGVRYYHTVGTYPQVRGSRPSQYSSANSALKRAVLLDEHAFAVAARKNAYRGKPPAPGLYETPTDRKLTAVSNLVASTLIPTVEEFLMSEPDEGWIAVTVLLSTGRDISPASVLFRNEGLAMLSVAQRVQRSALSRYQCLPRPDNLAKGQLEQAFEPSSGNYRFITLLKSGLSVGFAAGEVGSIGCGRIQVTVPFNVLRPYLSLRGTRLVASFS